MSSCVSGSVFDSGGRARRISIASENLSLRNNSIAAVRSQVAGRTSVIDGAGFVGALAVIPFFR